MVDVAPPIEVSRTPAIWVRPSSNVQGIGSEVVKALKSSPRVTLRAIGAGAVNQAVKGSINARQQMATHGEDLINRMGFDTVQGNDGGDITAIVIHCSLF